MTKRKAPGAAALPVVEDTPVNSDTSGQALTHDRRPDRRGAEAGS